MGNRAVITNYIEGENFEKKREERIGIYVHWNGGRKSIEGFLAYCDLKDFRPTNEDNYGWARLCQIIANFFGGGLSIGIDMIENLDLNNYDNGVYLIENWKIIDRAYNYGEDEIISTEEIKEMVEEINKCQPQEEQLSQEKINEYFAQKN